LSNVVKFCAKVVQDRVNKTVDEVVGFVSTREGKLTDEDCRQLVAKYGAWR